MYRDMNNLRMFHGNAHLALVRDICAQLSLPIGRAEVRRFNDGEISVRYDENIRNRDVFIVQPTCAPVNDNLMALLLMADAARRASAATITAVIPYFAYARQDRRFGERSPISAKLVADTIAAAGVDRVVCVDLHATQIQGFFDIPVDNLFGLRVLQDYLRTHLLESETSSVAPYELVLATADVGGAKRVRGMSRALGCGIAICDRMERETTEHPGERGPIRVVGEVIDQVCVIVDDMIDTGRSLAEASAALHNLGARRIWACCSHPILSNGAIERIDASPIERVVVLDTVPVADKVRDHPKFVVASVAWLLAETIARLVNNQSVSALFR